MSLCHGLMPDEPMFTQPKLVTETDVLKFDLSKKIIKIQTSDQKIFRGDLTQDIFNNVTVSRYFKLTTELYYIMFLCMLLDSRLRLENSL